MRGSEKLWEIAHQWLPAEDYDPAWLAEFQRQVELIVAGKQDRSVALRDLILLGVANRGGRHPSHEEDWSDPLCIARIKCAINLQVSMIYNARSYRDAMDKDIRDEWPCFELVGMNKHADLSLWHDKWKQAGGKLRQGRMIAGKPSSIWSKLSDFGLPHPPFSLLDDVIVEEVAREEAVSLGLVKSL